MKAHMMSEYRSTFSLWFLLVYSLLLSCHRCVISRGASVERGPVLQQDNLARSRTRGTAWANGILPLTSAVLVCLRKGNLTTRASVWPWLVTARATLSTIHETETASYGHLTDT